MFRVTNGFTPSKERCSADNTSETRIVSIFACQEIDVRISLIVFKKCYNVTLLQVSWFLFVLTSYFHEVRYIVVISFDVLAVDIGDLCSFCL